MVWRSDGPQGHEAQKVMFEIAHLMHGRCLDLGCGPSPTFALAPHVIGIDNDKDLKLFGAKANPKIAMSCETLPLFADEQIDVILSSHMLEHIEDYRVALADWWRCLRPGGRLILYLPDRRHYPNIGMPGANPDHRHDFVPDDVTTAMKHVAWRSGDGWDQEVNEVRTSGFEYSFLQVYRKRPDPRVLEFVAKEKPPKTLGIVRLGAYGDALWITPILDAYKRDGWHITVYTQKEGEASLKLDPNIDVLRVQPDTIFGPGGPQTAELQAAYWLYLERKHDRFINLVGSVERTLLPHPADPNFWLPDVTRRNVMNQNYVQNVFAWAGVPFDPDSVKINFTPSDEERAFAESVRAQFDGPLVVINPSGSSLPKFYPHTQELIELLDKAGVHSIVVGDLRGARFNPPERSRIIGKSWTIRQCFAVAALADVVIGVESAIVNAVSHEKPLKIVLLSHSTANNLTRDWTSTIAVEPEGLACYPCQRIHHDWNHCSKGRTGAAMCQEAADAMTIADWAVRWINGQMKEVA